MKQQIFLYGIQNLIYIKSDFIFCSKVGTLKSKEAYYKLANARIQINTDKPLCKLNIRTVYLKLMFNDMATFVFKIVYLKWELKWLDIFLNVRFYEDVFWKTQGSYSYVAKESSLWRCYSILTGRWLLMFWRIVMLSFSWSGNPSYIDCLTCEMDTTILWKVHYCLPVDMACCPYSKSDVLSVYTCTDGQSYFNSCCRKMRIHQEMRYILFRQWVTTFLIREPRNSVLILSIRESVGFLQTRVYPSNLFF